MGKFYQCIQSYGPSFMTKFCSALYLENLLTNIFAKLNLRGGVSCMPAALLFFFAPASVRRPQFQRSSPLKPLGQSKPNFMWSIFRKGERKYI